MTAYSSLLRTLKRQGYQNKDADWQVVLVLPALLSYTYSDTERYYTDWNQAMDYARAISSTLASPSMHIEFVRGNPKKIRRSYKRNHPEWIFPLERTFLEKMGLSFRWSWRKLKQKIRAIWAPIKTNVLIQNKHESYLNFLFSK